MRLRHVIPVAMSLLALGSGAVASADGRDDHGNRVDFVPVHRVGGATGGELMGQWWGHVIEIPNAQNPSGVGTEALCVNLGRRGNVVAPLSNGQPATCTVRAGGDVF